MKITLKPRLLACCNLITKGCSLADIGCDHGYVPAFLMEGGLISNCIACDINEGPLNACKKLVEDNNISNIECRLSNGLEKVLKEEVDDILIAGMGGDLIVNILEKCDYIKEKHLILNPMTHSEVVRKYLYDNGFEICNDIIVRDSNRCYNVLDACYTGKINEHTESDYYLGEIKDFTDIDFFVHLLHFLENKQKGNEDFTQVINDLKEVINEHNS